MRFFSRVPLAFFMLHSALVAAAERDCGLIAVRTISVSGGENLELILDTGRLALTQPWDSVSAPPLSVSSAIALVRSWASDQFDRYDRIEIVQVSLQSFACDVRDDVRWYYVVEIVPVIDDERVHLPGNWVLVLMDGSITPATRQPSDDGRQGGGKNRGHTDFPAVFAVGR